MAATTETDSSHPPSSMSSATQLTPKRFNVLQQNLNKSRTAQEDLINSDIHRNYDILVLQEPFIDAFGNMKATRKWRVLYPTSCLSDPVPLRVVLLVSADMNTNHWAQIQIPNTQDHLAVQFTGIFGSLMIFNVYNDCHHSDSIDRLRAHPQGPGSSTSVATYSMWCGDFNRHHPMWDEEQNLHLFTAWALEESLGLIMLAADHDMYLALLKDIPTLESMSTRNWTQPDNIFCSTSLSDSVMSCMMDPQLRGPGMDHVPILMALEFPVEWVSDELGYNF